MKSASLNNVTRWPAVGFVAREWVALTEEVPSREVDIHIRVVDHGIGIPAEGRCEVFDGFTRAHASNTTHSGTGIALAICAKAIESHGGPIEATDGLGDTGTTITIDLRVHQRMRSTLTDDRSTNRCSKVTLLWPSLEATSRQ